MKKLINDPLRVVDDMLEGFVAAHSRQVRRIPGTNVIVRKDAPVKGKVGIVSGGGSGHEPAHAGYVGKGMLDAAVCGEVFTSPTPDQILSAIQAVDGGNGVLLIIKNYTGDVMNFEMAAELAEAEGIRIAKVIVNDDVAVEDSTFTTGRRGIAGTVFVHKIAGALAERGASLEEVEAAAKKAIQRVRSMGVAISPCIVPAAGTPGFVLGENEMEVGIGIHGEPGIEKVSVQPAEHVADGLLARIVEDMKLDQGDQVAVMINGLGATPLMELYIVHKRVAERLAEKQIRIHETFVGEYMTSLEMAGCSISLLKLDDELIDLLRSPADTVAFKTC
ncbi:MULTISPECIES: dihydroxyacetone kinase subunit DhaK [Geobacillus]|uniref:PTS-dependent dihydroxyacetone kinase, dihydroxyacetone-binding subunit DhaK n=1 Tax=Geobacillus icigianus TaxID=1430331 RepID=A0ABU6BD27_9BACL|nr:MULTISPECIES: dihydroxyacetone kinase subunit DhaK [Geobacillus]KYD31196.1 Phosphoenolpyruvate-dihydroxyacetone phosphotransferase, dihydroxyacetone binding subunit DhaK [Geobacillus sp. B4113_201601]MEB3749799.1 PTS-dependent dihydroxyacetone kinase, dihydroxyacetone-binding subunit DhaK [Geobacillus icigianus]